MITKKIDMRTLIEQAWEDRSLLERTEVREAVEEAIARLDRGELRVAEPKAEGG